jgi:hypothetical protein
MSDSPTPNRARGAPPTSEALRLDRLIQGPMIRSMTGEVYREVYRCVGLRGTEIVAVSADPAGLDHLVGSHTTVVDAGDLYGAAGLRRLA